MHDSWRPAHRLDRSPLPLTAAVAIYPHEDCVGNGRFRYAEYRSFSALYWSRSKAIKPQQIVPQAEFIGGKNEACHNRSHTTANPKQLTLLKMRCQVWRDYERPGRRQQQWPDAADVRAGT
jgi:hypothetical protein